VYRGHRESHVVTKKFEVQQLDADGSSRNDDNIDSSRTVSVSEVRGNQLMITSVKFLMVILFVSIALP